MHYGQAEFVFIKRERIGVLEDFIGTLRPIFRYNLLMILLGRGMTRFD
jgi:hypothetical protein